MAYQVVFYWDERGREPVREFLESLALKTRSKILKYIDILQTEGPFLKRPFADKLAGKLYELRVRFSSDNVRIIYYFFLEHKIVLLHAFRKKDWAVSERDIAIGETRRKEFTDRYGKGKIKI